MHENVPQLPSSAVWANRYAAPRASTAVAIDSALLGSSRTAAFASKKPTKAQVLRVEKGVASAVKSVGGDLVLLAGVADSLLACKGVAAGSSTAHKRARDMNQRSKRRVKTKLVSRPTRAPFILICLDLCASANALVANGEW